MGRTRKWGTFVVKNAVGKAFEDAISELQSLRDEMVEWRDNMEGTSLENTEKYEDVSEVADSLESLEIDYLNLPGCINSSAEISYQEIRRKGFPRWVRLSNAISALEAVKNFVDAEVEHYENMEPTAEMDPTAIVEDLRDFSDSLGNIIDECSGIVFPGMY
jgi:uncharacterized protein (UPF0147 family)